MIWRRGKSEKPSTTEHKTSDPLVAQSGRAPRLAADIPDVPVGADATSPKALADSAQKARFAKLFSQAVAVFMRDKTYGTMPVRNLQYLLVPAVACGQCRLGHAQLGDKGPLYPAAVALWASVSDEIDARLSANLDKPMQLQPNDWRSGDQVWLVTLAGDPTVLNDFLKQIMAGDLKGKKVKMRIVGKDGKRKVKVIT